MLTGFSFPASPEMDAGPIPVGLEHRESNGILPGAEEAANQTFMIFDAPKTTIAPCNIEMMRMGRSPVDQGCRRAFN
jgi:hypothetical protein